MRCRNSAERSLAACAVTGESVNGLLVALASSAANDSPLPSAARAPRPTVTAAAPAAVPKRMGVICFAEAAASTLVLAAAEFACSIQFIIGQALARIE